MMGGSWDWKGVFGIFGASGSFSGPWRDCRHFHSLRVHIHDRPTLHVHRHSRTWALAQ